KGTAILSAGQSKSIQALEFGVDGSYYIDGVFSGSVDFDPGSGIDSISVPADRNSIYLTRFNADGSYGWTRAFISDEAGGSSLATVIGLRRASDGTLVLAGYHDGQLDFDPGPGVDVHTALEIDTFVARFSPDGSLLSTKFMEGRTAATAVRASSLDMHD